MSKKWFISLFSGAGGLDLGFMKEGWTPALMADNWPPAVETLKANHPSSLVVQWSLDTVSKSLFQSALDTHKIKFSDISCVVGGPPCQAYSRLNQNQIFEDGNYTEVNLNDPRRSLFMSFLNIVGWVKPKYVVMENVFDLANRKLGGSGPEKDRLIVDVIREEFNLLGYNVCWDVLRATDYNVPQMRRRLIFLAVRQGSPSLPPKQDLATSVREEFGKILSHHPNQKKKKHSTEWIDRVKHVPPGGYYNDLPLEHKVLKPVDLDFISSYDGQVRHYAVKRKDGSWDEFKKDKHQGLVKFLGRHEGWSLDMLQLESDTEGCEIYRVMPRMGTYLRRIRWDISHTVTRNPLIHPEEHRELTVREKASIQTFPPDYSFVGKNQDQHILVGNAVPVNLGRAIARYITKMEE